MNQLSADQFNVQEFGHLGLVAATIDKLGLVNKIDQLIPCGAGANTTMGQRVKAMILNGLGFVDHRLYMFPKFMSNKPIERLFGSCLAPEVFNDDSIGRCLDEISGYGVTKMFSTLAMAIGTEHNLLGLSANADTTTLSLYGEYLRSNAEQSAERQAVSKDEDGGNGKDADTAADKPIDEAASKDEEAGKAVEKPLDAAEEVQQYEGEVNPWPSYGFAKNKRQDLKQMVLNLATTGKAGFPIWFEAHSGNASDKKILLPVGKKLNQLCRSLKAAPEFLVVGDGAMYEACIKEGGGTLWLTRVPETHGIAREMVREADSKFVWTELGNGYKASYREVSYKNIKQRWAVVFSQHAYEREIVTLDKKIKADFEKTQKDLWHLGNEVFGCQEDANRHLKQFRKKLKLHDITCTIEAVTQYASRGRPREGATLKTTGYKISGDVIENKVKTDQLRQSKGRFILATNQLDKAALPDANMLTEYKEQSKTESGFKFIKDNTFEVASVFLKKPSRIEALMMVMTLCLMVYAFVQYHIRLRLREEKETLSNQVNKPTDKPTGIWVFRILRTIAIVRVAIANRVQEFVTNMDELSIKVIKIFGPEAMKIYGVT